MIPELAVAMLACARIGAVHSIVFGGFSADSLSDRIVDSTCRIVITTNGTYRGDKPVFMKPVADEAIASAEKEMGEKVTTCIVVNRVTDDPQFQFPMQEGRDFWWHDLMAEAGADCPCEEMDAEDPLFILYTSGSTGKPKGVQHTVGGYMVYTGVTYRYVFDYHGEQWANKHPMPTLQLLGTVGEPINPEAWRWYHINVGKERCPIVDTWWQTETGGIMITPLPGAIPTKPGSATLPFFGVKPALLDGESGKELKGNGVMGVLAIKEPWPGQMRTIYGDHQRFEDTYFQQYNGYYFTGDGCRRDEDGYYWITGRVDDVINVSGHRMGTAEVESALVAHKSVAEAAVVGFPHEIKGQGIYAYVTLNVGEDYTEELRASVKKQVRSIIGPIATPDVIHWAPALPKTRSGKIMRRILRKIATNELDQIGDTTTLADPTVVDQLIENR